jgi:cytochrome c-type biogenesis protein CcmH/NrfF
MPGGSRSQLGLFVLADPPVIRFIWSTWAHPVVTVREGQVTC